MRRWWLVRAHYRGDEWPVTATFIDLDEKTAERRARAKVDELARRSPAPRVELIERSERSRS